MTDWNDETDVSPYLKRPLRSYSQAAEELRRHNEAVEAAFRRNGEETLIPFPQWRRRGIDSLRAAGRGLRRPA